MSAVNPADASGESPVDAAHLDPNDSRTWPELMTTTEVAQAMRINQRTVLAMINDGRLRARRAGTAYRVSRRWLLEEWFSDAELDAHPVRGRPTRPPET